MSRGTPRTKARKAASHIFLFFFSAKRTPPSRSFRSEDTPRGCLRTPPRKYFRNTLTVQSRPVETTDDFLLREMSLTFANAPFCLSCKGGSWGQLRGSTDRLSASTSWLRSTTAEPIRSSANSSEIKSNSDRKSLILEDFFSAKSFWVLDRMQQCHS